MPKGAPPLSDNDIVRIRDWITYLPEESEPFPGDSGLQVNEFPNSETLRGYPATLYILDHIARDARNQGPDDRRFYRYFASTHSVFPFGDNGFSHEEANLHKVAFIKAVHHLSNRREPVHVTILDDAETVFRIDLRELDWHLPVLSPDVLEEIAAAETQLKQAGDDAAKKAQASAVLAAAKEKAEKARAENGMNPFDLLLIEYPYGVFYNGSDSFELVAELLFPPGELGVGVRNGTKSSYLLPVPYIRTDWLVANSLRPPLYHDLLGLPLTVQKLEERLGVDRDPSKSATRGGLAFSGVSKNNRAIERLKSRDGYYWQSFDFATSSGSDSIFSDPVNLKPDGGEYIFRLPNGVQGYFISNSKGERLDEAPVNIVSEPHAADRTVRAGLSCIRCHVSGIIEFTDDVRVAFNERTGATASDAYNFYPGQSALDIIFQSDVDRFLQGLKDAGADAQPTGVEPISAISLSFENDPVSVVNAAHEIGTDNSSSLANAAQTKDLARLLSPFLIKKPIHGNILRPGVVHRDTWEEYFDIVVRTLEFGTPVVPLDGLTNEVFIPNKREPSVELLVENLQAVFRNRADVPIQVDFVVVGKNGKMSRRGVSGLLAIEKQASSTPFPVSPGERVFVWTSTGPFNPGTIFSFPEGANGTKFVSDRFVHLFFPVKKQDNGILAIPDDGNAIERVTFGVN